MSALRVVIAGVGRFGTLHLRTWREAGAEVVAVTDVDLERARSVAREHGVGVHGRCLGEVLEVVQADAVVIVSDETSHSEIADAALSAGCHVFVEKPLALSTERATATVEFARDQGLAVVVGQISRFAQPYRYLRQALDSGRLGELWAVRLRRDFSRAWFATFGDRVHPVWESCIHDVDLAVYLAGGPARRVVAQQSAAAGSAAPSVVAALVEFDNGVSATIESAWSVPDCGPQTLAGALALDGTIAGECEVIAEFGTLRQRLVSDALVEWGAKGVVVPDLSLWPDADGRVGGALRAEIDYALAVFAGERDNDVMPPEHAVWGVQIAEAMVRSLETGEVVSLSR